MKSLGLALVVAASGLIFAGCDVDVKDKGETPDVDVSVEGGRLPDVDVRTPDVDISTKKKEVTVPDVKVDIPQENETEVDASTEPENE
jgi:hypothetical protein